VGVERGGEEEGWRREVEEEAGKMLVV